MSATVKFRGNAQDFLKAFLKLSFDPKRYRVPFDEGDLKWLAKLWDRIAILGVGDPAREAFLHEKKRFETLWKQMRDGMAERSTIVAMTQLDKPDDWPRPEVIRRALALLQKHEVRIIQ